jgi:hypothetical protein
MAGETAVGLHRFIWFSGIRISFKLKIYRLKIRRMITGHVDTQTFNPPSFYPTKVFAGVQDFLHIKSSVLRKRGINGSRKKKKIRGKTARYASNGAPGST